MGRVREHHDLVWGGQVDSIRGFDARIGDYSSTMSQSGTYDLIFPQRSGSLEEENAKTQR
jgi:hypothetical protein